MSLSELTQADGQVSRMRVTSDTGGYITGNLGYNFIRVPRGFTSPSPSLLFGSVVDLQTEADGEVIASGFYGDANASWYTPKAAGVPLDHGQLEQVSGVGQFDVDELNRSRAWPAGWVESADQSNDHIVFGVQATGTVTSTVYWGGSLQWLIRSATYSFKPPYKSIRILPARPYPANVRLRMSLMTGRAPGDASELVVRSDSPGLAMTYKGPGTPLVWDFPDEWIEYLMTGQAGSIRFEPHTTMTAQHGLAEIAIGTAGSLSIV